MNDTAADHDPGESPSKSSRKREHQALQELARELCEAPLASVRRLSLDERTARELLTARGMRTGGSRNRQLRLLAQLLAGEDTGAIRTSLDSAAAPAREVVRRQHAAENWRERVIAEGASAIAALGADAACSDRLRELRHACLDPLGGQRARRAYREIYRTLLEVLG